MAVTNVKTLFSGRGGAGSRVVLLVCHVILGWLSYVIAAFTFLVNEIMLWYQVTR